MWIQANHKLSLSVFPGHSGCSVGTCRHDIFKRHKHDSKRFCKIGRRTFYSGPFYRMCHFPLCWFHGKSGCVCSNSCIDFFLLEDWIALFFLQVEEKVISFLGNSVEEVTSIFKISFMMSLIRPIFSLVFFLNVFLCFRSPTQWEDCISSKDSWGIQLPFHQDLFSW